MTMSVSRIVKVGSKTVILSNPLPTIHLPDGRATKKLHTAWEALATARQDKANRSRVGARELEKMDVGEGEGRKSAYRRRPASSTGHRLIAPM